MWNSIQYVSTATALVAFIFAAAAAVYARYINRQARLIESASDDRRAELVRATLEFFHVDTSGLTREQRYNIAMEQIRARASRFRIAMVVLSLIALLSSALMAYALSKPPPSSQVEVVEVSSVDNDKMEIVIRNRGSAPAFIKGVQLVFGPMSCGSNVCMPGLGFTRYEYNIELSNEKAKVLHKNIIEVEKSEKAGTTGLLDRIKKLTEEREAAAEKQAPTTGGGLATWI